MIIDQYLKKTLWDRYFTEFILVIFGNWPVVKSDTVCWIFNEMGLSSFGNWQLIQSDTMSKRIYLVDFFTFAHWLVNKVDTIYELFYWVEFGYIQDLTSELKRYFVFAIMMSSF